MPRCLATIALLGAGLCAASFCPDAAAQPAQAQDTAALPAQPAQSAPQPGQSQDTSAAEVPPATAEAPTIELITMGAGDLLWEKYGHAALCVRYRDPRRDRCYNYGTTDFSDPVTLVWEFLRGQSKFWVSVTTPARMVHFYRDRLDRSLWVQRLPLAPEVARETAAFLANNALDENKYYKYHHYDDNCSTRVRDIIDRAVGGALSAATEPYPYTLREITRRGMAEYTFLVLLSDFPLGRRADRYPSTYEAMHLPFVLRAEVEHRLGIPPKQMYQRTGRSFNVTDPPSRWWLFLFALACALPALLTRLSPRLSSRAERLGLALSVLPGGVMGATMWFMAIISTLPEIRYNEVLLVLLPFDLALPFLSPRRRVGYARGRVVMLVVLLLLSAVGVLRQPIWALGMLALLPCLIAALPGATPAPSADDDRKR
ncbi:DUF4105 domain-containing protein [Haliangium sp.]|uniref:Lnb N-terminal periplasmic domain-containing protein n=1 Tax=Haliangium sp. TaxID=2663208 RepID=UPI003D0A127B